jgi:N-acetylmuramoyl-L-alanine amidase
MTLIANIRFNTCPSTTILDGLNQQLVKELNLLVPDRLVRIDDGTLNVSFSDAAKLLPFVGGPTAKARLKTAIDNRGVTLRVNSAYRTFAQQYLLFRNFNSGNPTRCGITAVSRPGNSNHESGLALDIQDPLTWRPFLEFSGLGWRWYGSGDPPHYDFIAGGTDLRKFGIMAFQQLWNKNNPSDKLKVDGALRLPNWQDSETIKRLLITPTDGF